MQRSQSVGQQSQWGKDFVIKNGSGGILKAVGLTEPQAFVSYNHHLYYMCIMCFYNTDIHWSENRIQQTLPSVISPCSHITTKLLVFWVWVHYACIICLKWKVICINAVAISCLCFAFFYTVTYSWYYYHVATFWPKYWHLPLFLKSISINNFILSHFVEFDAWAKYLFNPIIVPSPQCLLHGLL